WGATLYDFYHVYRIPGVSAIAKLPGSKLLNVMKKLGEFYAKDELLWAANEEDPRVVPVADTKVLIEAYENRVPMGIYNEHSMVDAVRESATRSRSVRAQIPPSEPLDREGGGGDDNVHLQERIPLHLLPETLYAHDPFNVLSLNPRKVKDTTWLSQPDLIRKYTLSLSPDVQDEVNRAKKRAEEMEELKARTLIILRYTRTKEQVENHEPTIEVPLPPYHRRLAKVEDGHLYISPVAKIGSGNHSVVYKAEWELPRDLLMEPRFCEACMKERTQEEIQRLKDSGRWDKLLRAADGEVIEREITCIVSPAFLHRTYCNFWNETRYGIRLRRNPMNIAPTNADSIVLRVNPTLTYQNPSRPETLCQHRIFPSSPVPRTARFNVAAKLSIENDRHLAREAQNYQKFPEHFFQNYNGYNIVPPIHDPVPVHALVPQFYGYYTPSPGSEVPTELRDDSDDDDDDGGAGDGDGDGDDHTDDDDKVVATERLYLSPILLLEHCGSPIEPDDLSIDDQQECTSLFLRLHEEGWLHESVAARNILAQQGSPTEFPAFSRKQLSFRLIDFGRSRACEKSAERMSEETAALALFRLQHGAFLR
ncbi:hypothetical protein BU15DRAFT_54068, partial [Melanogaster broomeanus]